MQQTSFTKALYIQQRPISKSSFQMSYKTPYEPFEYTKSSFQTSYKTPYEPFEYTKSSF